MQRIFHTLLIIIALLSTPLFSQTRYGGRFPSKENAAPPRLILSDGSGHPISMTLSGEGHARWLYASDTDNAPYRAGLAGILTTSIELSKSLKIDYEMETQQPNLNKAHSDSQPFYSRLTLQSIYDNADNPFFEHAHTKIGNLQKITLGQGLTLKHLESDGLQTQFFPKNLGGTITTLAYTGKGYSQHGHTATLTLSDLRTENGIYVLSRIDDQATFNTMGTLWGIFGRLPLPGFDLVYEGGFATQESREAGFAGMISPRYTYKSTDTTMQLSATLRGYTNDYLAVFNKNITTSSNAFVKTYHSLMEEDEDYDNWRNILINQAGTGDTAGSVALNARIDQRIVGSLWGFTQAEWVEEHYNHTTLTHKFLTTGVKLVYSPDHTIYMAMSNKLLNSDGDSYSSVDTNQSVLRQVPMFFTMGMVYRF